MTYTTFTITYRNNYDKTETSTITFISAITERQAISAFVAKTGHRVIVCDGIG